MEFFFRENGEIFCDFARGKILKYLLAENADKAEKIVVFRRRHH